MITHRQILISSITNVTNELTKNKLRSFLSLFGVTIGVFCIISVLATVNSLEYNIRTEMKALGTNTIYVDKWEYSASGPDYPYWKFAKRPVPRFDDVRLIQEMTPSAGYVAFKINSVSDVSTEGTLIKNAKIYGISEQFNSIQPLEILYGNYFNDFDFSGTPTAIVGADLAEKLFGSADRAVGKAIQVKGQKLLIAGVSKKQGKQILGGWGFDESVVMPYRTARTMIDETRADPLIIVKAAEGVNSSVLKDDLTVTMRGIHRLRPGQENDFSLNDINDFSKLLSKTFGTVNLAGWSIGALSFIVGIFGVANIMFVSVKERTSQIGIKKALGSKRSEILIEFLLESALLCIIGGLIGLALVFILITMISHSLDFPLFVSVPIMFTAIFISVVAGVIAGILPAAQAARMNPITAIRS